MPVLRSRCHLVGGIIAAAGALVGNPSPAAVTVSTAATKNIVCSGGVCNPNHKDAVLNVTDLQNLLASGDEKVTTGTGALAPQVSDIVVNTTVTWTSAHTLTLDAYRSVTVNKTLAVAGTGGLAFVTDDGGSGGALSFGTKGNATFWSTSDSLTINGAAYTLVANIATLASDIAANPSGDYALAANYNATTDGTYTTSPIATTLSGTFEGLGNSISHLSIDDPMRGVQVGLFANVGASGAVMDLRVTGVHVLGFDDSTGQNGAWIGGLVAQNAGLLSDDSTTGYVAARAQIALLAGGLAGTNNGTIRHSHSTVSSGGVSGLVGVNTGLISNSYATGNVAGVYAGGLVGENYNGAIEGSYAIGTVGSNDSDVGGLVAINVGGSITNCYATGAVSGQSDQIAIGGLVGGNGSYSGSSTISNSYSTGRLSGNPGYEGGLVGYDYHNFSIPITNSDWDTTTSGVTNLSQGAGFPSNDPGITGLSTTQLQSGLPAGFDPSIWGESPSINGGLPYLLANPPQ